MGRPRRRSETARRAFAPDYRAFVEHLNDIVFCLDLELRITFINPAVRRIAGYEPEEMIGRTPGDFTHPEDLAAMHAAIERALKGEIWDHQMRIFTKHGETRVLRVSSRPILRRGRPVALVGVATDVTGPLQREEALRRSEALYRALVEQQVECVCRWLPDTTLTFVNSGYCRFFRRRPEQLVGRRWLEFVPPQGRKAMEEIVAALVASPCVRSYEHEVVGGRGEIVWQEWTDCPIYDAAGKLVEFQSVGRDTTARRRADEALRRTGEQLRHAQKMEAVGVLTGGVAHEFNNLLMGIGGYAHLVLARTRAGSQTRRDVERVCALVERGAELTRQLLAFGRNQPAALGPLDLNAVLGNMTAMLKRVIGEDIDLQFEPGRGMPPVHADLGQIEQVVMNLAVNARDAMPRGGRLRIATERGEITPAAAESSGARPGPCVVLTVSDTGCGMDERTRERIFEPFFTTKEVGRGTGLGLPLVNGAVQQHGGSIEVETAVGRGTTFRIRLPVDPAPAPEARPPAERAPTPRGTETVLIVDDDASVRESLARIISGAGYRALSAATPDEAEAAAAVMRGGIDLLLADVVLPERSGPELRESLLRAAPGMKTLYLSGYPIGGDAPWRVPAGFPVLAKPVNTADLLRAVRAALGG
jgi:PAS domain S-box-containing protein